MDLTVPEEVYEFARSARGALSPLPGSRTSTVLALQRLGYRELDALSGVHQALAAGYLAAEIGRAGLEVPIAGMLTAVAAGRDGLVQAVDSCETQPVIIDLLEPDAGALVVDIKGDVQTLATIVAKPRSRILAPHLVAARTTRQQGEGPSNGATWWCLYVTFAAFRAYGALTGGMEHTVDHVKSRSQFGRPSRRLSGGTASSGRS